MNISPRQFACLALLAAVSANPLAASAAPDSCLGKVAQLNASGEKHRFARFVAGVTPGSRPFITNPANDSLVDQLTYSCLWVATALDRLMAGSVTMPVTPFTSAAFNTAVNLAVTGHQPKIFRFKIPVTVALNNNDNLGHHFLVELSFDGPNAGANIYMSYEGHYRLDSWMKNRGEAKGAIGTGKRRLTIPQLKAWGVDLDSLMNKLTLSANSGAGAALRKQAFTAAGALNKKLFGLSWVDMDITETQLPNTPPANMVFTYSAVNYLPATCRGLADTVLQQAKRTCNADICA